MFAHGDSAASLSNQVLLYAGRGPWNDEGMKEGAQIISRQTAHFAPGQHWAQLSCLYGECIMPPSTFQQFSDYFAERQDKGLRHLAIVILQSEVEHTIRQQFSAVYCNSGLNFQFFNDIDAACQWLALCGFPLEQRQLATFLASCSFVDP